MLKALRPKLLFYIPGLVDGGAERLWACLASAFRAHGYPVVFVQDFEARDNRQCLDPAIPLHTVGRDHRQAIRRLAGILADEQPDVALSAVAGSNLKLMIARSRAGAKVAPILTFHGAHEWKTGLLSWGTFAALPLLSRRAARVVAVSEGLRRNLVSRWGASARNTITILNPVFIPAGAPVPSLRELTARAPLILAAGRLSREKDFQTLIRAFALVEHPDARLVILGKGPEHAALEAEIGRLGLGHRIELAGYVREPWSFYRNARLFVSSSRTESFGNAIVEAMAHGLSVVATTCEGPREILDHGTFGHLVPPGNPAELAAAIDRALDAPADPAVMRARADQFSFQARFSLYERLVASVHAAQSIKPRTARQDRTASEPQPQPRLAP